MNINPSSQAHPKNPKFTNEEEKDSIVPNLCGLSPLHAVTKLKGTKSGCSQKGGLWFIWPPCT